MDLPPPPPPLADTPIYGHARVITSDPIYEHPPLSSFGTNRRAPDVPSAGAVAHVDPTTPTSVRSAHSAHSRSLQGIYGTIGEGSGVRRYSAVEMFSEKI